MIKVTVNGLAIDTGSNSPVMLLKEVGGNRVLPIWIGPNEAVAIAMVLTGTPSKRPMTHDLMKMIINGLGGTVTKVIVSELKDQTFYAQIHLQQDDSVVSVDARPSDSIALALRVNAAIYVAPQVFETSLSVEGASSEDKAKELRERLRKINPEDFGSFSL